MSVSSSRVRAIQRSASSDVHSPFERLGDLGQQRTEPVVDDVDPARRAAVAQRRPHREVDEHPDADPDRGVGQPRGERAAVVRVARQQDDQRGRGGRGRLVAQALPVPHDQRDEQHGPQRDAVDAEQRAGGEGEQDAEHGRADLLRAAPERAVDGGVDGQQRRPRGEERLREVEHVDGDQPGGDRRHHGLDDLQRGRPGDRVAHALPEPLPHTSVMPGPRTNRKLVSAASRAMQTAEPTHQMQIASRIPTST